MTLALPPSWTLPAAIEVYKRRQDIASAWRAVLNVIIGKKRNVVVTGMAGAGKTLLLQALTGEADRRGFRPQGKSMETEHRRLQGKESRRRIALAVVPGQASYRRSAALDDLLLSKKPVDGVVHVVCNGFAAPHVTAAMRGERLGSIEALRASYLEQEREDLKETLELMRRAWKKHHQPFWMLVAVTKADLYQGELTDAWKRYAPGGEGGFVEMIGEFQGQIGRDNFEWDAQPVSAWLEAFEWNGTKIVPQIDMPQRDHYLATFASVLERHCA